MTDKTTQVKDGGPAEERDNSKPDPVLLGNFLAAVRNWIIAEETKERLAAEAENDSRATDDEPKD